MATAYYGEYRIDSKLNGSMITIVPGVELMLVEQHSDACPNGSKTCSLNKEARIILEIPSDRPPTFIEVSSHNIEGTRFVFGKNIYNIRSIGFRVNEHGVHLDYAVDYLGQTHA